VPAIPTSRLLLLFLKRLRLLGLRWLWLLGLVLLRPLGLLLLLQLLVLPYLALVELPLLLLLPLPQLLPGARILRASLLVVTLRLEPGLLGRMLRLEPCPLGGLLGRGVVLRPDLAALLRVPTGATLAVTPAARDAGPALPGFQPGAQVAGSCA
jgi:hypothetical protein